jgi:TRAP transporter TAXI family solute receptor
LKKTTVFIVLMLMIASLVACSSNVAEPSNSSNTDSSSSNANASEPTKAKSDEPIFLSIGTASLGGNFFPMGTALGVVIEKGIPNVKATGQATGGSSYNLTALDSGELQIGISQSVAVASALNGTGTFEKPITTLSTLLNYHPTPSHIIVRKSANVKSVDDLRGKKLEMLAIGDGNEANAKKILDSLGVGWDEITPVYSGNRVQAASSLQTGKVDGIIDAAGVGSSWLVQILGDGEDFEFISLSDSEIEKITSKYPEFSSASIPANTYEGQPNDVTTVTNWTTLMVRTDMDEELVYEITKAIFTNLPFLQERHAYFKELSLETAPNNVVAPLHPGAERYYKDVGALKKDQ